MFQIHTASDPVPMPLPSGDLVLIGRGEQCDIRLEDPSASRVHCRLLSRGGKVTLTDAGSRWGTFVNGLRVNDCELCPGDEITVGETTLKLTAQGTPNATTLVPPRRRPAHALVAGEQAEGDQAHNECRSPALRHAKPPSRQPAPLQPHDYLGAAFLGCRIDELLHRAPSGLIFRARRDGHPLAVKLFHPGIVDADSARQRFLRGVDTAKQLRHAGLVLLEEGGINDGVPYTISELIVGESAADMIHRIGIAGMLDWRTTLRIGQDIAAALEFLESNGVLHRNITPENILISKSDGSARLSDLLLSKALDDSGPAVTNAGETVGDLPFLSPEQVGSGQPIDHRSDIYQLGATLYALLTGRPPFAGRGPAEIIQQILLDAPTPPTRYHLAIPPQLEGVVLTMLQKRPADRFTSAAELSRALTRVQSFASPSAYKSS